MVICEPGSNINQPSETNPTAPKGVAPSPPESIELPPSGDGPPASEWVLVGVADSSQLGSVERLAELEKMKRTAEHGNNLSLFILSRVVLSLPVLHVTNTFSHLTWSMR